MNKTDQDFNRMTSAAINRTGTPLKDPIYLYNCIGFQQVAKYLGDPAELPAQISFEDGSILMIEKRLQNYTSRLPKGTRTYDYLFACPVEEWGVKCSAAWLNGAILTPIKNHARPRRFHPDNQETRQAFLDWLNADHKPIQPRRDDLS
jgi:hypothetical protein